MKYLTVSLVLLVSFIMSGCGVKPMYEYSDYSESYYQLKQNGDSESTAEWRTSLEESIEKSNARAIRIPPGVNANLGYLYLKTNNTVKAISFFKIEKKLYPESTIFMNSLIKKAKLIEEGNTK